MTRPKFRCTPVMDTQFWLLGLDAQGGVLRRRGFARSPAEHGSSRHRLGTLELHSAGLRLTLPQGELHYERRLGRYRLNGQLLPAGVGFALCWPHLLAHEAWVAAQFGPDHRSRQLAAHRLSPAIRRAAPLWAAQLERGGGLAAQAWVPRVA